ncbi:MAG: hypothetical protein ACTSR8_21835 [Promethearchaeota archaeon]
MGEAISLRRRCLCDFFPYWDLVDSNGKVNKAIGSYLYKLSEGRLGRLIQIVRYGGVNALLNGRENISREDYKSVFRVDFIEENGDLKRRPKQPNKKKPVQKKTQGQTRKKPSGNR